ncbi:hypothetical protein BKA12_000746 [Neomicrococcus lactis]|uniref:Lactococcin 972 family bacteriocin n=1 Tax=Neomicrococcus lactis TaxID=732241 RepID=A0A7W9DB31_9MICC|nr:hypothetical protein [Neomicrococcus lactis]
MVQDVNEKPKRSKPGRASIALTSALALSLFAAPIAAYAAESQYANSTSRIEDSYAASSIIGSHTGGRGFVSGNASLLYAQVETRSASTYSILAYAVGQYGGPVTMTHAPYSNSWSLCKWYLDD